VQIVGGWVKGYQTAGGGDCKVPRRELLKGRAWRLMSFWCRLDRRRSRS